MVDFICSGLLELQGKQIKREIQNKKKSCPQWDSNPVPYAYEADALRNVPRDLVSTIG